MRISHESQGIMGFVERSNEPCNPRPAAANERIYIPHGDSAPRAANVFACSGYILIGAQLLAHRAMSTASQVDESFKTAVKRRPARSDPSGSTLDAIPPLGRVVLDGIESFIGEPRDRKYNASLFLGHPALCKHHGFRLPRPDKGRDSHHDCSGAHEVMAK